MNRFAVRQMINRGGVANFLIGGASEGLKVDRSQTNGVISDHMQPYSKQSVSNFTYLQDKDAHSRRRRKLDQVNDPQNFYPLGQASEFGLNVGELAFKDPDGQIKVDRAARQENGSLIFIETYVHTVFNGARKRDHDIEFVGVVCAGKSGQVPGVSSMSTVTIGTGGTVNIINNGDFTFGPGDKVFWDAPATDASGAPLRVRQSDVAAGHVRYLPEIVKADALSIQQINMSIAQHVVTAGEENFRTVRSVNTFLKNVRADFGFCAHSDSVEIDDLAYDPVTLLAAYYIKLQRNEAPGEVNDRLDAIIERGMAAEIPSTSKNRRFKALTRRNMIPGAEQGLMSALMHGHILSRIRGAFDRQFIGTAQRVSAPGETLIVLLGQ